MALTKMQRNLGRADEELGSAHATSKLLKLNTRVRERNKAKYYH